MSNLNQDQVADAVASGKLRYDLDQTIGLQIMAGVLCLALGLTATVPVGVGLLALTIWLRKGA